MRAQRIMERVQEEQRRWYGVKEPGQTNCCSARRTSRICLFQSMALLASPQGI
uniref:Uncharacterized protein n=1 Tax=Zea mays TaxID=4577 RepID=A0A804PER4_MAIZE